MDTYRKAAGINILLSCLFVLCHVFQGDTAPAQPAQNVTNPNQSAYLYGRPPIVIGGLWALSGQYSGEGKAAFIAARKAVEEINRQGGISGRPIELVVSDTRGEPGPLLVRTKALIYHEKAVAIIGPSRPELSFTLSSICQNHKTPLILTAGSSPLLPRRSDDVFFWTFGVSPDLRSWIKSLYRTLAKTGIKTIGPLVADTPIFEKAGLWLTAYAPEYRLKVLPTQTFGIKDVDVLLQLQGFKEQGADAVIAWGPRYWGPVLIRSSLDTDITIAVPSSLLSERMLQQAPDNMRLLTVAPPVVMGDELRPDHPCAGAVSRFLNSLGTEFNRFTIEELLAAGTAWDAIHLLKRAIALSDKKNRAEIRNSLENLELPFYGVMGIFLPNKRDHNGLRPDSLIPLKRERGEWRYLLGP